MKYHIQNFPVFMNMLDYDLLDDEPVIGRRFARPGKRKLAEEIADGTITNLKDLQRKSGARARKAEESKIRRAKDDSTQVWYPQVGPGGSFTKIPSRTYL